MAGFANRMLAVLGLTLCVSQMVGACDPTILTDFGLVNATSGDNFKFDGLEPSKLQPTPLIGKYILTSAVVAEFPGLQGLSISSALVQFGAQTLFPLHVHPRASEIIYVQSGQVLAGFIDTANVFYSSTLNAGDLFVIPQGLIHFQFAITQSVVFAAFNSINPGLEVLPLALFFSNPLISSQILSETLGGVGTGVIDEIRLALSLGGLL